MADDRPTLKVGNTSENCLIRNNFLSEGNINVTDGGTSNVDIGDKLQSVTAENIILRKNTTYSISSNHNAGIAAPTVLLATTSDGRGAVFSGYTEISNTNQNVTADNIHNKININLGVRPKRKRPPIRFQYRLPVEDFIGRQEELSFLKEKLCIKNPRVMIVSGLGGIGKTQLVKRFIEENKEFYRNIVWINAQGRGSIEEEFKILAESKLGISVKVNGRERDFRCLLDMIFGKLSTSKTLLVFDNVDKADTAEIVLDIVAVDVKPHILITSRIQEFSESVDFRKLEVFSLEESLEYISKKLSSDNDNESPAEIITLADTLKNLPLALRQATAHIKFHRKRDKNYKICNYIAEFNKYREQILGSDLFQKDIFNQYKETTLTTWKITLNAISECRPHGELALRILHIMAYFDNVHIMREIFFDLKDLSNEPELNERQVISAVGLIVNYSMVDDYEYQSVLSIHKLVQEVIQIQLANERRSQPTLRDGFHLISQMVKNGKFKLCFEHGISVYLSALIFTELVIEFDAYPSMILLSLNGSGNYLRALGFGTEINEQFKAILGNNHRRTIQLQFDIAISYNNAGRYSEALQMYKEVLEKRKIILGEDHPDTISTQHNIARSYGSLGKFSESIQMYEVVLEKRKIILGEYHPDTILTEHNVANSYNNLGKYSKAIQMYDEVLVKMKIVFGEDHTYTISTKHNIARSYNNLGKYSEALQMYEEVLEKRKIILGEDHPDTIHTKFNFADLYSNLGKYYEALQMYEEILKKRKIILGKDHPLTILTAHNIADLYNKLGKSSEAFQRFEEVLEKHKIILGEDHPDTIRTRHNIACSYSNLGKYSEALQRFEDVLEKKKIILGVDHPHTILTMFSIADSYSNLAKYSEALQMYEKILKKRKIILGEDHPDTILTRHNIAYSYSNLGKCTEALQRFEDVLEKRKIILGEDHPHTILTMLSIADSYSNLAKYSEALQMYEEILKKRKIILGEDHPDTIATKSRIAELSKKFG